MNLYSIWGMHEYNWYIGTHINTWDIIINTWLQCAVSQNLYSLWHGWVITPEAVIDMPCTLLMLTKSENNKWKEPRRVKQLGTPFTNAD